MGVKKRDGIVTVMVWILAGTAASPGAAAGAQPASGRTAVEVHAPTETLPTIAGERREIDLDTVLRLAREQNLTIARAGEEVREQRAEQRLARSQYLPNVGIAAGQAALRPNIATIAGTPAGRVTLSMAPGRVYYDARAARFAVQAAEFRQNDVTQDVLLEATARYLNLQLARGFIGVAQEAVAQAAELERQTRELQSAGLALNADLLRAQARVGEEQQRLVEAQRDFKIASIQLATLLRLPPAVTLIPQPVEAAKPAPAAPDATREALVERALQLRPELGEVSAEIQEAEMRRKGAFWGSMIPFVGVEHWFGGISSAPELPARRVWFFVEWRLLDNLGMSTRGRIDRARSQERQARLRREQLKEQVTGEVLAAQQAIEATAQQIEVARQQVTAAEGALTVFRERYMNGLGLQLDVLAAQRTLAEARQILATAEVRFSLAQAELQNRLGGSIEAPR